MGKKDENLRKFELCEGSNVPEFIVLPIDIIDKYSIDNIKDMILEKFRKKYFYYSIDDKKFSVRSSGSVSTPGRMSTVLNVNFDTLKRALNIVNQSSKSSKLDTYLKLKNITDFKANIIIQNMVKGYLNTVSCSGVLLTENPFEKDSKPYIEFIPQSTGLDLMNGEETPQTDLETFNPKGYEKLLKQIELIKENFPYLCSEVEFVIQDSEAYILQIREYKTNSSMSFVNLSGLRLETIGYGNTVINHACKGIVTFDKNKVNLESIFITETTEWEDTELLLNTAGVITLQGGRLSHASSISKEFYIPAVIGAKFDNLPQEGDEILFTGKGEICKILKWKIQ